MKKLNPVLGFLLSVILSCIPVSGHNPSEATLATDVSTCVVDKDAQSILTSEEARGVSDLAANLELSAEKLAPILLFKVKDKNCALVPICNIKEHKDCFTRIFSKSDPDYMKYYMSGKLKTEKYVLNWAARSFANINRKFPRSTTFLIKVEDKTVGRIGIGPLHSDKGKARPEIGYALEQSYSGQGIMSEAVNTTLNFLKHLRSEKASKYEFTRLRATAKVDNVASNHILLSRGFKKSPALVNDGYGSENEYFYYF